MKDSFAARAWQLLLLTLSVGLAACGGGDNNTASTVALWAWIAAQNGNVTPSAGTSSLSGTVTYDYVPNTHGPLDYAATTRKPVRGATVEVFDASGHVVATTQTDANGAYAAQVPAGATIGVRVVAQMRQLVGRASWNVSVRDNTRQGALYAMESPLLKVEGTSMVSDVHAPSGWGGLSYTGPRTAAPFAILDTIYAAKATVLSAAPSTDFPLLFVYWSPNNVPAPGDRSLGQIETSHFEREPVGGDIYVLGKEDVDTDEYDASVIAHEWGHYYQAMFSRDDSVGGSHSEDDLIDRRVAFSEGWGNGWAGIALGRRTYTDSAGPAQQFTGIDMDLSLGLAANPGWFRETSIQAIFWNLAQQTGFPPIHEAMTGPFKTGVPVTSIHPFATAFAVAAPAQAGTLAALLAWQSIESTVNDPWGNGESNDGGIEIALPMYKPVDVKVPVLACVTPPPQGDTGGNKLGNFAYLRLTAPEARNFQITIEGPPSASPAVQIYGGKLLYQLEADSEGSQLSASVNLPAGDVVLAILNAKNSADDPSDDQTPVAPTCFDVVVN